MFTGIIEAVGRVVAIKKEQTNVIFEIESPISSELKIDQSITHNGACLTVTQVEGNVHAVTAIAETLEKTNLGKLTVDSLVNLERCMQLNGRFDGHIVQGHVDQTATCIEVQDEEGSWRYTFQYSASNGNFTVEKGSVCINGVSLTVVDSKDDTFSVAIIPYTYEHTNFKTLQKGDTINLEFDIIGKYLQKLLEKHLASTKLDA